MDKPKGHRFSGWPGAWCLDCGSPDPFEIALGRGHMDVTIDESTGEYNGVVWTHPKLKKKFEQYTICKQHGANRFNPYDRKNT